MDRMVTKRQALERKRQRIRKKVSGDAERPRLAVYRSEKHIYAQIVDDESGRTIVSASTRARDLRDSLKDLGPSEAASRIGEILAEKAQAAGVQQVVFDRGGRRYIGRVAALAEAARGKGLQF